MKNRPPNIQKSALSSCHAPCQAVGPRRVRSTQRRQDAPHGGREGWQVVGVRGALGGPGAMEKRDGNPVKIWG